MHRSQSLDTNRLGDRPRGVVSDKGEDAHPNEVETVRHKVGSVAKQPWGSGCETMKQVAQSTKAELK